MGKAARNKTPVVPRKESRWMGYVLAAVIVVAVFVAYSPAIRGAFLWDDDDYVSKNELLTASDGLKRIWFSVDSPSQYFPLVYTTFRIEHAIWGLETTGYHVVNILLHLANAFLIYLILRRLKVKGDWLAAAIFALHPVHVESVAWITERKNVLSTLFYLLAVLSWMRFTERSKYRYYGLTLGLTALALFAKTTACTLPAALLLVSWVRGEKIDRRKVALMLPVLALGIGMGLVSVWWEVNRQGTTGAEFNFSMVQRILLAGHALWFYLGKLVWPAGLTFSYPRWSVDAGQPVQYVWVLACILAVAAMWIWRRRLGRGPIAAGIFFAASLVPLIGFIPLYTFRYSFVADHYQYVASIGPIALVAAGLAAFGERTKSLETCRYVLSGLVVAVLGVLTWTQAHAYGGPEALWRDVIAKNPSSWLAQNNLANVLDREGRTEEAMPYYEAALRLNPDYPEGQINMGIALVDLGRYEEALPHYKKAIELSPTWADAYYDHGVALGKLRRFDEAIEQYAKAIDCRHDYMDARNNLGVALIDKGRLDDAISVFREALAIEPEFPNLHNNLAVVLYYAGSYAEAWSEVHLAEQNGDIPNPQFVQDLSAKIQDPGGQ